jgi:hypothetical protein
MELKNRGRMGINPVCWKNSSKITGIFSAKIFKRSKSKVAWNIGLAVRNTIPGIGPGNPITISNERLLREKGLDDFAVRVILFEHLGRKLECECQILNNERELRKETLGRQFSIDFDSGDVGLVD